MRAALSTAAKRADTATIATFYADDAVVMMANTEAWRGRRGNTSSSSSGNPDGSLKIFRDVGNSDLPMAQ
jgi:ketosteroid isomerase-like protein